MLAGHRGLRLGEKIMAALEVAGPSRRFAEILLSGPDAGRPPSTPDSITSRRARSSPKPASRTGTCARNLVEGQIFERDVGKVLC